MDSFAACHTRACILICDEGELTIVGVLRMIFWSRRLSKPKWDSSLKI